MNSIYTNKKIIFITTALIILATLTGAASRWLASKFRATSNHGYLVANIIPVQPPIDSIIKKIHIKEHQYVTIGELLIELENKHLEEKLLAAEADLLITEEKLRLANIQLKPEDPTHINLKVHNYLDNNDFKSEKIMGLQRLVDNQQQLVDNIKIDLLNTKIYAPATGWIHNLAVSVDDKITAQQLLANIILQEDKFWVEAKFNQEQLKYMRPGQTAEIILDMYPDYIFNGNVTVLLQKSDNTIWRPNKNLSINNPSTDHKIITVRIEIDNSTFNLPLKIGNPAQVTVHTNPLLTKSSSKTYS